MESAAAEPVAKYFIKDFGKLEMFNSEALKEALMQGPIALGKCVLAALYYGWLSGWDVGHRTEDRRWKYSFAASYVVLIGWVCDCRYDGRYSVRSWLFRVRANFFIVRCYTCI